jgi:DNA-directed RNA polymerase specialized sigma24 family protein
VLEILTRRYWRPVYHYLRVNRFNDADARDITQDFFVEVVLGRDLFGQADEQKGRFRPYLLHCLKNFIREHSRHDRARCRSPERPVVSIECWATADTTRYDPPADDVPPDRLFHRQWAASLLEQVVQRLATDCQAAGLGDHYTIFHERFVRPALEGTPPAALESLANRFGLTTKQAANRGETVRRRFRGLLLDEVRLTVSDQTEAEDELRGLLAELRG